MFVKGLEFFTSSFYRLKADDRKMRISAATAGAVCILGSVAFALLFWIQPDSTPDSPLSSSNSSGSSSSRDNDSSRNSDQYSKCLSTARTAEQIRGCSQHL